MMKLRDRAGLDDVRCDMERLCLAIGQRLAGSPEEKLAAKHVAERFEQLGLSNVAMRPFPCQQWIPGGGELTVLDGSPRAIACQVVAHSAATPAQGVDGDLVIFEPIDWERGLRRKDLAGKIAYFHGGYGESAEVFRQLHESDLAALIFCDTRVQSEWPVGNGVGEKFMRMVRKPMIYISLMDAWALARDRVKRVRVACRGRVVESTSHNVVGELPGDDPHGQVIVVSGHIDSVAVGYGADDDASGVAAMIECARRLRDRPRRHTLRFIGFGAEEQLSAGSTRYVRSQLKDLDRIGLACNFDSIAAWLGLSQAVTTGTPALDEFVSRIVEEEQRFGLVVPDASPYQDTFAFCAEGVPGIWFTRETHPRASWYHHSAYNSLENCSMEQIAWAAETACEILGYLAVAEQWPFPRAITLELTKMLQLYREELFD